MTVYSNIKAISFLDVLIPVGMREIIFLGSCCKYFVQGCLKGNHENAVHARKNWSELFG